MYQILHYHNMYSKPKKSIKKSIMQEFYSFIEESKIIPQTTALFLSYYYALVNSLKFQVKEGVRIKLFNQSSDFVEQEYAKLSNLESIYYFFRGLVASIVDFPVCQGLEKSIDSTDNLHKKFVEMTFFQKLSYRVESITADYVKNGVEIELFILNGNNDGLQEKYAKLSNLESIYYFFRGLVASIVDFPVCQGLEKSIDPTDNLHKKFLDMTFFQKLSYRAESITAYYVKMGVEAAFVKEDLKSARDDLSSTFAEEKYAKLSNLQPIYYFFRGLVASIVDHPVYNNLLCEYKLSTYNYKIHAKNHFSGMSFFEKLFYRARPFLVDVISAFTPPTYESLLKNMSTLDDNQFDRLIKQISQYDLYLVLSYPLDIDYKKFKLYRFNMVIEKLSKSQYWTRQNLATRLILNIGESNQLLQTDNVSEDAIIQYMAHVEDNNGILTGKKIEILTTIHQNSDSPDVHTWATESIGRLENKSHHSYGTLDPLENTLGRPLNYYRNDYRPAGSSNSLNYRPGQ